MNTNAKIIERIHLLLNLGRSPNPHEAEAAVAMAAKLMDDYRISKEDVDKAHVVSVDIGQARASVEHRLITYLLQNYFNVLVSYSIVGRMRHSTIHGNSTDTYVALQVYRTLMAAFKQRWNEHKRKFSDRTGFMYGIKDGIESQLQQNQQKRSASEQNALVVIHQNNCTAIKEALKKQGMNVKNRAAREKNHYDIDSYCSGYTEGLTVKIYDQLPKQRSLLPPNS